MKKNIIALLCCFFTTIAAMAQDNSLQVMTFNIRYNNPGDSINAWPNRADKVASQILYHQPAVLGVQEALWGQMQDLSRALPQYKFVGAGRDDGDKKGEFSAIFYDTARMQLLDSKTFWLSETPEVIGSKGWDAAICRIVTYARFRDRKSRREFYHFNTHFDHIGKVARRESAKLLLQKVNEIAGSTPAIITGDFNAKPQDEPIRVIVDAQNPLHLKDAKALSKTPHYGPHSTFNSFKAHEIGDQPIDYIFLKGKWEVWQHACITQTWKGLFASDHFAQVAKLTFAR
ncbi:endonuclease/exonuclease/phosphatase family protein [Chitinophaga sp. XS-30]|uniref:endonuclease/exonuclease/phosphatase family protein n=1 Tax=Chitinophaga sp. XS-30 TaxID=2604421 RepID=UPI0011DE2EC8|nr:endonuclease/exonuclease/phosphatase family protein [Chitinophaga sp. XS-30]QEH40582.1 endonuclease/exonuclease/phosphatase family protein [Chitinophaga sp. XS-30]